MYVVAVKILKFSCDFFCNKFGLFLLQAYFLVKSCGCVINWICFFCRCVEFAVVILIDCKGP